MKKRYYKIEGLNDEEIKNVQEMVEICRPYDDALVIETKDSDGNVNGFAIRITPWTAFKAWISFTIENITKGTRLRITKVKSK